MKDQIKIVQVNPAEHTHIFEECPEVDQFGKATGYSYVICIECGTPKDWNEFIFEE